MIVEAKESVFAGHALTILGFANKPESF